MGNRFKNAGHLIRLALVFIGGIFLFLALRSAMVPKSFGQYGHYRGDALRDIAAQTPRFARREACENCHQDIADLKKTGKHSIVGCEACHGPLAKHVEDPASVVPVKPDTKELCVKCHEANSAKPKSFPQVISKEHAGDTPCGACHQPHKPKIGDESATPARGSNK
jgi:hypothetical protein